MKYKVGNKVKIKNDLELGTIYDGVLFVEYMNKCRGMEVTIKKVCDGNAKNYLLEESPFHWGESMLENIEELDIFENKYPEYIMRNVRENLGLESNDTSKDREINEMDKIRVLDAYLTWEGIIGYTYEIISIIEDIFEVELNNY